MNLHFVRTALLTDDPSPHSWRDLVAWLVEKEDRDRGAEINRLREQVADLECELDEAEYMADERYDEICDLAKRVGELEAEVEGLRKGVIRP